MQEEWKEIEGYSRYTVSTFGRVWDTKNDCEVSQVLNGIPRYYYVNMTNDNNERKMERVNRLVAIAFVEGRSEEYNISDHKDRNKLNNHYTNLRWTDHSGNQRNLESSVYFDDIHILDFTEKYENPRAAYQNILGRITEGDTKEEAVAGYEMYLEYGNNKTLVEWEGQSVYLIDLCSALNRDYELVRNKLSRGWDIWNAIYNVAPPSSYHFSIEVPNGIVCYWYKAKNILADELGIKVDTVTNRMRTCVTLDDIKNFDALEKLRVIINGVSGTITELCKHFGVTEAMVNTRRDRYGMTLEEALTVSKKKVKVVYLNGERMSTKDMYESFDINAKRASKYRSANKASIEQTLEYFGVDTSSITLEY